MIRLLKNDCFAPFIDHSLGTHPWQKNRSTTHVFSFKICNFMSHWHFPKAICASRHYPNCSWWIVYLHPSHIALNFHHLSFLQNFRQIVHNHSNEEPSIITFFFFFYSNYYYYFLQLNTRSWPKNATLNVRVINCCNL